jgi:hypothetical protein
MLGFTTYEMQAPSKGAGNYGAREINRYGEKLVMLDQVLCDIF